MKKIIQTISWLTLLCLLVLTTVVLIRTVFYTSKQINTVPIEPMVPDDNQARYHLADALRLAMFSDAENRSANGDLCLGLHTYLAQTFPRVHLTLQREVVGHHSLLYTWTGSDPALRPILISHHLSRVPAAGEIAPGWADPSYWEHDGDGQAHQQRRLAGTLNVMAVLEAVEALLTQAIQPQRTVYLAFGHEEIGGDYSGAAQIAKHLKESGIHLASVLEASDLMIEEKLPGQDAPIAFVGIAEKGSMNLELTATRTGGTVAQPPSHTAIGAISKALYRLETHPPPSDLDGATEHLLEYVGPELPFLKRLMLANLWLFKPFVMENLAAAPSTNAAIRTTLTPTHVEWSARNDRLPACARATVHVRLQPGDSPTAIVAHARKVIGDTTIRIRISEDNPPLYPSVISDTESGSFKILHRTVRQVFPSAIVAPHLLVDGTNARYYETISNNIYRFRGIRSGLSDSDKAHGTPGQTLIDNYLKIRDFYYHFLRNATSSNTIEPAYSKPLIFP